MATMNISLPDKMKEWVERQTEDGSYSNASDYVRDLIRKDQERERVYAEIRAEAQKGIDSGMSPLTQDEVFRNAMDRARAAAKRKDSVAG